MSEQGKSNFWQKLASSEFFKSSVIISIVNIFNALLNYSIVVIVSNIISNQLSDWTALTGIITILSAPIVAANLEVSRKVSVLADVSSPDAHNYLINIRNLVYKSEIWISSIFLFVTLLVLIIAPNFLGSLIIPMLITFALLANLHAGTSTQFLIGDFETGKAALTNLINACVRFGVSILGVSFGLGVVALPLGILAGFATSAVSGNLLIQNVKKSGKYKNLEDAQVFKFDLLKELKEASNTILTLTALTAILYLSVIVSNEFFNSGVKDLYAVLFNFGQITFFGATIFMSVFMAHSARTKNLKIYFYTIGAVGTITLGIIGFFAIFGSFALKLFNRTNYIDSIPLILTYLIFIMFYNIIYVSTQFLLAKNHFGNIFGLFAYIAGMAAGLVVLATQFSYLSDNSRLLYFTLGNVFFGATLALIQIFSVLSIKNKLTNKYAKASTNS